MWLSKGHINLDYLTLQWSINSCISAKGDVGAYNTDHLILAGLKDCMGGGVGLRGRNRAEKR